SEYSKTELERLRHAPIILNWDEVQSDQPLMSIRSGRRGVGDHAITVFRATESIIFDLSHIFFDGPWGMAVAEILTGQAIVYARQLREAQKVSAVAQVQALDLEAPSGMAAQARRLQIPIEVSGESTLASLKLIEQVRSNLRKRNSRLLLTVNDILI